MASEKIVLELKLEDEHSLAAGRKVEQSVNLISLFDTPAVCEDCVDIDAALGGEVCTLRLDQGRERPGSNYGDLLAQKVWADIQTEAAALPN